MSPSGSTGRTCDLALVSLGTTPGLRGADEAFAALVRELGASCQLVRVQIGAAGRLRRHIAVTDLVEALAARSSARGMRAGALVYSTVTAALLQRPRVPYAVRFDSPAALNRPGWPGAWQRARERRVLARARVLLPWGAQAAAAAPDGAAPAVMLPVPIDIPAAAAAAAERDIDALAYAGYPRKRGLDVLCAAWAEHGAAGLRLVVGGLDRDKALRWLDRCGVAEPEGVEWAGELPRERWLELVGRARVFVNASRQEDHGLSQLEALAAGAPLVTVPSPGAYEALPLASELASELVAGELSAPALARALDAGLALDESERADYGRRASALLVPYRLDAVRETLAREVLPALGVGRT